MLDESRFGWVPRYVCAEAGGAFTGQVSAVMLKDVGCRYVVVGHSERRRLLSRMTRWYRASSARS